MENNLDYGRNLLNRAEYLRGIIYKPREPMAENMTIAERRERLAYNTKNRAQKKHAREELKKVQAQLIEYVGAF